MAQAKRNRRNDKQQVVAGCIVVVAKETPLYRAERGDS
jgi:hypothetical protein